MKSEDLAKRLADLGQVLSSIDWDEDFYHERPHDFELWDEVRLKAVYRYKSSNLSGSEWRYGVVMEFYFKGQLMKECSWRDMETAMKYLPVTYSNDEPISDEWLKIEKETCDQVACPEKAVNWFALRRKTDRSGHFLEKETDFVYYRKFCEKHSHRGDSDREDCDENMVKITRPS